jgi:hypothetical protein
MGSINPRLIWKPFTEPFRIDCHAIPAPQASAEAVASRLPVPSRAALIALLDIDLEH